MQFVADHANAYYGYVPYQYPHPLVVPLPPSALTATAISTSVIGLAWTINATDATAQKVRISTDGVNFTPLETIADDAETYNATGLASGTQFWFDICASNANGDSAYCDADDATTDAAPTIGAGTVLGSSNVAMMMF